MIQWGRVSGHRGTHGQFLDGSSSSCPTPTAIVAKRSEIIVEMFDLAATASSELPVTMETTTVMFGVVARATTIVSFL